MTTATAKPAQRTPDQSDAALPWTTQKTDADRVRPWQIIAEDGAEVARVSERADAEFIVRACNSHDALVAALRDVLNASQFEQGGKVYEPSEAISTGRPLMDALQRASAALKRAGEA